MRHTRKKESNSSGASSRTKKGRKSRATLNKPSAKNRAVIKGDGKSTRKKTSNSRVRIPKQRTQKTSKVRSTKRSPIVRASRKSVIHKIKSRPRPFRSSSRKQTFTKATNKKIIRVLGYGQYSVDGETLRKLNAIDNSIVRRFEKENLTNEEFKMKIGQLGQIVTKKGKLLNPKVIVSSDIILPGNDLTIEEASKIFRGEGIISGLD
jgi:PspAA-like protein